MNVRTLPLSLRAVLSVMFAISSVLPAAGQTSPEGFPSGASKTTTVTCDSCCSVANFNCSNTAVKTYVNENLDSCVVCTGQFESRARGCGMIRPTDCPACPTPGACPVCPTSVTPASCPTPITCPGSGTPLVCPTPAACPKSCPITKCAAGEQLWNPDSPACECVKDGDVCKKIGDLTKIAVNRYHPNNDYVLDSLASFTDASGANITNSKDLDTVSPCMEAARDRCTANLLGEGTNFGFYSYRNPDQTYLGGAVRQLSAQDNAEWAKYVQRAGHLAARDFRVAIKHMDTCIVSTLETQYGIGTLTADKDKVMINGVSGDHWQGTALLYKDCRPVEPWKQQAINGAQCSVDITANFNEFTSPVSLLWSRDVKIKDVASRSKFPLNPKEAGKWFVWRGSGLTPLVVWDPDKTGLILDAERLFGTHTWGKEWKHGYEPLATLDKDSNGWLEGDELTNMALWFDFNQDGISDKGEVKQLQDVGVTALGVKVTATDEKNGEVHAEKGFRRTVNGSVIEGASVDWFSSSEEGRFGFEVLSGDAVQMAKELDQEPAAFDPLDEVSGLWDWRVVDPQSGELPENMPHGTLVLYSTNKQVAGTLYVMDQFAPNQSGIGERVTYRAISGVTEAGLRGGPRVSFSTKNQAGGTVESEAQLSEDGKYLTGITTEQQEAGKEPVKYAWVARRAPIGK